jgi:hypothetical protein
MPRFTSPLFGDARHTRSDTAHFPRRFPRQGGQFQMLLKNLPAVGDALSSRPLPTLVSRPWIERNYEETLEKDEDGDNRMEGGAMETMGE